jgi:putative redox protein
MILTENEQIKYKTKFSNSITSAYSDTTIDKGGNNSGFRPHELLEAALASCLNIQIRMYAEHNGIDLTKINVTVALDRNKPEDAIFDYKIDLEGNFSEIEKIKMLRAAETCPVKKTLSRNISFRKISCI